MGIPHRSQRYYHNRHSAALDGSSGKLRIAMVSVKSSGQDSAPRIVALTGFMGAGKSSIGRALAALLGWRFVDLDEEIEAAEKMPICSIFRLQGEPRFREMEIAALRRILAAISSPTVIALGGGTFIQAANAKLLRTASAQVVFLDPTVEEMLERCHIESESSKEHLRPLAADPDAFRTLHTQRLPHYRKADLTVNTAGKTVEESAEEISAKLQFRFPTG